MPHYYDNTRIGAFKRCPRKFNFRHIRHWTPEVTAEPLAFGAAWHKSMDSIWKGDTISGAYTAFLKEFSSHGYTPDPVVLPDSIRNVATAHSMIESYVKANRDTLKSAKLIASEQPFAVPLDDSGELYYVGRQDKIVEMRGRIYTIEHKTTTQYKKDGPFRDSFLKSFNPNGQIDGYLYAGFLTYGEKYKGVWIDAALVHQSVRGYRFIPVEKQFAMVDAWLWETKYYISEIQLNINSLNVYLNQETSPGYLPAFPRNTESCDLYAGCSYHDVCRFYPDPTVLIDPPQGFVVEKWEPYNELKLEQIGLEKETA